MNCVPFLFLLVLSRVRGFLIDTRNYEKSLVLSLEPDLTSHDGPTGDVQFRVRRELTAIELIAFKVESIIKYRYSRTYVTSHVRNSNVDNAEEVTFQVILPETAFISKFFMEIDGRTYEAYVKEKEEAKRDYVQALSRGQSAGLLELNARHSNVFNVNVNIKANTIVNFNLTYEELLSRRLGRYEQIININGGEISKTSDVEVVVDIEESQTLRTVKALNIQNELDAPEIGNADNPDAIITKPAPNRAHITWRPSSKFENLKRFIVEYDTNRELDSGEVLIMNGYFVHFFAPPGLKPLQKHVVFVLDVSGSMSGRKIIQLKEAMQKILSELKPNDYFNIIIFSTDVVMWAPGEIYHEDNGWKVSRTTIGEAYQPIETNQPYPANAANLDKAKTYITSLIASGGTNINAALLKALDLTSRIKNTRRLHDDEETSRDLRDPTLEVLPARVETLILFLTDGEPTEGVTDLFQIQRNIQNANLGLSVPIFSLAFGDGADFPFLRRLSLQNYAFARKIYEAADAALQLQGFYSEISSPLLSNVQFNYTSPEIPYSIQEVTRRHFPTYFDGWEFAVAGKIEPKDMPQVTRGSAAISELRSPALVRYVPTDHCYFYSSISGTGYDGIHHWHRPLIYIRHPPWWCYPPHIHPTTTTPRPPPTLEDSFLERLWAYLTIKNLIESDIVAAGSDESPKQRALRLAIKYGFVTAQTSLVVVKPDATDVANAESADKKGSSPVFSGGGSGGGGRFKLMSAPSKAFANGFSHSMSAQPDMDFESATFSPVNGGGGIKRKSTTTSTTSRQLTIKDIVWIKNGKISVNNKEYQVAMTDKEISKSSGVGRVCTIRRGSKLNKIEGKCEHLKNCIKDDFLVDFENYKKVYFCSLPSTSSSVVYAGACCPEP